MDLLKLIKIVNIVYIVLISYEYYKAIASRRRWWIRPVNLSRNNHGFFNRSFINIKENDPEHFQRATRMSVDHFQLLLNLIKQNIEKHSNRKPISAECRLAVTLVYLAHGCSMQVLAWSFKMGVSIIREIILETCDAIWELNPIYVTKPNYNEWIKIAQEFEANTGMPNCVGSIDGKHINIKCPPKSGSLFYNYKGHHSLVLLGVCDSNYSFTAIDVGAYGSQSDGGILKNSGFGKQLANGTLEIPSTKILPNSIIDFPYYFVGDAAFPLKKNLMRPYPGKCLSPDKENFNKKLSKARIRIENSFGILANRWRILGTTISLNPKNAQKIILATVLLHNFLMLQKSELYCPYDYVDKEVNGVNIPGNWRDEGEILQQGRIFRGNRSTREAFILRDVLKQFLEERTF